MRAIDLRARGARRWIATLALVAGSSSVGIVIGQEVELSANDVRNLARSRGLESLRVADTVTPGTWQPLLLNAEWKRKVPLPPNLNAFLRNNNDDYKAARLAAAQLGKALFWDQAIGSDGKACASCHFHAGADSRMKNQLNPDIKRVFNQREGDIKGYHNAAANPDNGLEIGPANYTLQRNDWPFVRNVNQVTEVAGTVRPAQGNSNDTAASQGVFFTAFQNVTESAYDPYALGSNPVKLRDRGEPVADPTGLFILPSDPAGALNGGKANLRRVEPRNTPSMVNAIFNLHSFWDGRANFKFNGVTPFGDADSDAVVYSLNGNGVPVARRLSIRFASLASQAVGPGLSDFEMSFAGRVWPQIGRKMLNRCMLEAQKVASDDSLLGPLTSATNKRCNGTRSGLGATYADLIQQAFDKKYWEAPGYSIVSKNKSMSSLDPNSPLFKQGASEVIDSSLAQTYVNSGALQADQVHSLMEMNFSFFFGMAVMLYEAELVADDSRFDRFMAGNNGALSEEERAGLHLFVDKAKCANCHGGPELSKASVRHTEAGTDLIEPMVMGDNEPAIYDNGFYNIGMTPTVEDVGRGGAGPNKMPLASSRQFLFAKNAIQKVPFGILGSPMTKLQPKSPFFSSTGACLQPILQTVELGAPPVDVGRDLNCDGKLDLSDEILIQRVAVDGAFKTPMLRNIELTGPYGHNGGLLTLRDVVEFYNRGGNFCRFNLPDLDPDIEPLGLTEREIRNLVAFLLALTDERTRYERKPFDHPELRVPNGHPLSNGKVKADASFAYKQAVDDLIVLDAVGASGGPALAPVHQQLDSGLDHFTPSNPVYGVCSKH